MKIKSAFKGYLFIIASAVLFGCMPLIATHIYADGVNALTLVWLRGLFSLPFLFALALIKRERISIPIKNAPYLFIVGLFGCALTPLLLFSSYNYISGGTATVFHFSYPAIVLIFELIFNRGRVKGISIISILICVVGISMFYTPGSRLSFKGSILAIVSGVMYAIYIFLLGRFGNKGISSFTFGFYITFAGEYSQCYR